MVEQRLGCLQIFVSQLDHYRALQKSIISVHYQGGSKVIIDDSDALTLSGEGAAMASAPIEQVIICLPLSLVFVIRFAPTHLKFLFLFSCACFLVVLLFISID